MGGYVTTIYMSLFFLLSGLFYKPNRLGERIKRLILPYLSFLVIGFLIYAIKEYIKDSPIEWGKLYMPLCGNGRECANPPIWFLLALMEIIIINHIIYNYSSKRWRYFIIIAVSIGGFYMSSYGNPYSVGTAMLCSIFFFLGKEWKKFFIGEQSTWSYWAAFAISILLYVYNMGYTNVSTNFIPVGYVPFILISILATYSCVGLSKWIDCKFPKMKFILCWLGENSLAIMLTHLFFISIQDKIITLHLSIYLTMSASLLVVMIIDSAFVLVINKYAKFLLGKQH